MADRRWQRDRADRSDRNKEKEKSRERKWKMDRNVKKVLIGIGGMAAVSVLAAAFLAFDMFVLGRQPPDTYITVIWILAVWTAILVVIYGFPGGGGG